MPPCRDVSAAVLHLSAKLRAASLLFIAMSWDADADVGGGMSAGYFDAPAGGGGGGGSGGDASRRLLQVARDLEGSKSAASRRKAVQQVVELIRDSGPHYRKALDEASAAEAFSHSALDWSGLLSLALGAVTEGGGGAAGAAGASSAAGRKAKAPAAASAELWQHMQYLFEQSEQSGHFINQAIIDTCLGDLRSMLHLDGGGAGGGAASDKEPIKRRTAISALAAIMECILAYAPYAQAIKQEHFHGQTDSAQTAPHQQPTASVQAINPYCSSH